MADLECEGFGRFEAGRINRDSHLLGSRNGPVEYRSVVKICWYHKSANHHECSYKPRGDTCPNRVTSVQDRICLDYFCRIGVNEKKKGGVLLEF